jgi:hypothetical protein
VVQWLFSDWSIRDSNTIKARNVLLFLKSRPSPGTTQSRNPWVTGFCPAGEVNRKNSSGAEVRTDGAILHSCVWFHGVDRDSFTVTCIVMPPYPMIQYPRFTAPRKKKLET